MHLYVQLFLGAKHDRDTWFLVMKRTAIKGLVQKKGQNEAILKVNLKLLLTSFMTSFFLFFLVCSFSVGRRFGILCYFYIIIQMLILLYSVAVDCV